MAERHACAPTARVDVRACINGLHGLILPACHFILFRALSNPAMLPAQYASRYTFHLEAVAGGDLEALQAAGSAGLPAVHDLVAAVKAAGMLAGLTVKPGTPVELLLPYVPQLDMVRGRCGCCCCSSRGCVPAGPGFGWTAWFGCPPLPKQPGSTPLSFGCL